MKTQNNSARAERGAINARFDDRTANADKGFCKNPSKRKISQSLLNPIYHLTTTIILLLTLSSAVSRAQGLAEKWIDELTGNNGYCGNGTGNGKIWPKPKPAIPDDFLPFIDPKNPPIYVDLDTRKKEPWEKFLDNDFKYWNEVVAYSVAFRTQNPTPPSCEVIKGRLKNQRARLSELTRYTDKMDQGIILSSNEIKSLQSITREYLPQVLDEIDQKVELHIRWAFQKSGYPYDDSLFYFITPHATWFENFIVEGPALRWEKGPGELPPFFDLKIDHDVTLTYEMSALDFCFGQNNVIIQGKMGNEFSNSDPILFAEWERDVLKLNQMDFWTIQRRGP